MTHYAMIDEDGAATAFFDDATNKNIPRGAFVIDDLVWRDWVSHQNARRWIDGVLVDIGEAPSPYHNYNNKLKTWVEDINAKNVDEARIQRTSDYENDIQRKAVWDKVDVMSKDEFADWFDNQITDLPTAKNALKLLAVEVARLRRIVGGIA